jgi:hypothetical protein
MCVNASLTFLFPKLYTILTKGIQISPSLLLGGAPAVARTRVKVLAVCHKLTADYEMPRVRLPTFCDDRTEQRTPHADIIVASPHITGFPILGPALGLQRRVISGKP